jgi:regulator of RNase E activity RraA
MHKVHATIKRPSAELIARFKAVMREVVTENVSRAQMMDPAVKPLNERDWSIVGPAVTVKIEAFDHLMSIAALGVAKPGDVVCGDLDGVIVVPLADAERVVLACEEKTRRIQAVGKDLIANKTTLFAHRGGKALIRKAGVEWID